MSDEALEYGISVLCSTRVILRGGHWREQGSILQYFQHPEVFT